MKLNSLVLGIVAAVAVTATPSISVFAQDTEAMPPLMASLVCRAAQPGETPTAITSGNSALVCKPLNMQRIMAMKPAIMAMADGELNWKALLSDFTVQSAR